MDNLLTDRSYSSYDLSNGVMFDIHLDNASTWKGTLGTYL